MDNTEEICEVINESGLTDLTEIRRTRKVKK